MSLPLGWLIAGRFLRPLRTITATARGISASNLNLRLDPGTRHNEFAERGETLNGLFGRLEASFESQRRFVALTLGLRPGELRALRWDHVDLTNGVIHIWRSTRHDGDTKTKQSRRSLSLPKRAASALKAHKKRQAAERLAAGTLWQEHNLVFCHEDGQPYSKDQLNWRFGKVTRRGGLGHWHPHEGRHTAVSIMSANGVPIQDVSDTVGHKTTYVTEAVYRKVIVPEIRGGATVMDAVFGEQSDKAADT